MKSPCVDILSKGIKISQELNLALLKAQNNGCKPILFIISSDSQKEVLINNFCCTEPIVIDGIEDDPLGLISSQTLKWSLNLISNGAMIMMGKVLGNRMIDVRTSNNKLIDRCIRNLYDELTKRNVFECGLNRKNLYNHVIKVHRKNQKAEAKGIYTPSSFKIVLMMLVRGLTYEVAIEELFIIKENVSMIF